ncbi:MAG: DUF3866 family protein [Mycobacteriales bacterium]
MIAWRRGTVVSLGREWPGARELMVAVGEDALPALAYPDLVGAPRLGDAVLLNVAALDLGLGTGGYALVIALPDRLPPDRARPGHLVKARYTPMQTVVLGADEQEAPSHAALADDSPLPGPGMPVVVADLHSSLPAVLAGILADRPGTRVAYVMTDGGALPLALSRTVAALRPVLVGTVTVGQAYGGDLEAVTLHSGLLVAARVLNAEIAVAMQGPGNLGTGTSWGFSGVAAGEAINAAVAIGARPVAALRMSQADLRVRHRGVSHHSKTAYGRVALVPADIAVPSSHARLVDPDDFPLHRIVVVEDTGLMTALRSSPAELTTMGRGLDEDPLSFLAAAAAGRHASSLL